MIKFRIYYDKDAETKWLNKLSQKGWAMTGFFAGFYTFEKCEEGKYEYQIDFGDRFGSVSNEYREFMQEAGIEIVQNWGYWIILRKISSEKPFELYTDVDSAMEHYSKIRNMFKVATIVEMICLFVEVFVGMNGNSWGYAFALLIAAILIAFINVITRLNETIATLQERKTGIPPKNAHRNFSPLIPVGLLINSCAFMLSDSVSTPIRHTVQIVAIVFMLAGLFLTSLKKE